MSEPGGKGHAPRLGADQKKYGDGHELAYGRRCFRHPSVRLDEKEVCPRCVEVWERYNDKTGEWEPREWKK